METLSTGRLRSPIAEADHELSPPGAMPNANDAQREAGYGSRGAPGPSDSPAEMLSAVSKVSTATFASQLRKRGFNHVTLDRLLTTSPSQKMAGSARTVRYVPFRDVRHLRRRRSRGSDRLRSVRAARVRVGDPADPATEIGALVHPEHYDRVMSYVRLSAREGARLVAGGSRPAGLGTGNYPAATVFADVRPSMRIFTEEIFGPVVCVTPFDSEQEAVTLANATRYGLAAYLWTSDLRLCTRGGTTS